MSLFDQLVSQALKNQGELAPLQAVVEKELLHHDILREMSNAGLLKKLTFIGGTCLRSCYGSNRLSEDLDFTGGEDFKREVLASLGTVLVDRLQVKYNLQVEVSDPVKTVGNVDTWKLKIITRPQQKYLPKQRIHIDICAIPSYDRQPMILRNHYGVEMGTSGLIIQAQSREEILADKMVAFALRRNRIKNRDLWDIGWLKQQNIILPLELMPKKLQDHQCEVGDFLDLLKKRQQQLIDVPAVRKDFIHEMQRFLPSEVVSRTIENEEFWTYLVNLLRTECTQVIRALSTTRKIDSFKM
ncbi:MAG: nucleotidyl transferase AbiEii/AbiGii toxin family protein [Thermodesulfobacteriota bacterium]|nr:nucleotidyl transferase AbiEii/AbiGii toxin family protein [Thermodesulfobacteriota bacterium]